MQMGVAPLGVCGLGEILEPVFTPVAFVAETEGGLAGIIWLVEIEVYLVEPEEAIF
jgi:hypothetical protein